MLTRSSQRTTTFSCRSIITVLALLTTFGCATSRPTATQSARAAKVQSSRDRGSRPVPQGVIDAKRGRSTDARPVGLGVQVKKASRGIEVVNVLKNSPAEEAGLRVGDVILEINKKPINTPEDISAQETADLSARKTIGSSSRPWLLDISRGDDHFPLTVRLGGTQQPPSGRRERGKEQNAAEAEQIDPGDTSNDPTFGYAKETPVKLGSPTLRAGGSYVYLDQLRDKHRKPFNYKRIGNVGQGADDHVIDLYSLIDSEGVEHRIYIDMYHPENTVLDCKAPKGMFIAR